MTENTKNFVEKFFKKFPNAKIDFSNSEFQGRRVRIRVKCCILDVNGKEHGEFEATPEWLMSGACACPKCQAERKRIKFEENFKKKFNKKYKDKKFDTSKVHYIDQHTPVCIICHEKDDEGNEHDEFWMTPSSLLLGHYCLKCRGLSQYDYDSWIAKANKVHNNKYIYQPFEYKNKEQYIDIICPIHGHFRQQANSHIRGAGCAKCAAERIASKIRNDRNEIIKKLRDRCDDLEYVFVEEDDNKYLVYNKFKFICPKHGENVVNIGNFLYGQTKCKKCAIEEMSSVRRKNKDDIVSSSNDAHKNKYDYSLFLDDDFEYKNVEDKIPIICHEKDDEGNEHGIFWNTIHAHQAGRGCPICSYNNFIKNNPKRLDKNELFKRLKEIHENKYVYNEDFEYSNIYQYIDVYCSKHGWFKQRIINHLNGQGCPLCKESKLERQVRILLNNLGVKYTYQYKNKELLNRQSFDFYLDDFNIAIECQGIQHFMNDRRYQELDVIQKRDDVKNQICKEHNIKLIYYFGEHFNEMYRYDNDYYNTVDELREYLLNVIKHSE